MNILTCITCFLHCILLVMYITCIMYSISLTWISVLYLFRLPLVLQVTCHLCCHWLFSTWKLVTCYVHYLYCFLYLTYVVTYLYTIVQITYINQCHILVQGITYVLPSHPTCINFDCFLLTLNFTHDKYLL